MNARRIPNDPYGRELLEHGVYYPLADPPHDQYRNPGWRSTHRAIWTGEHRAPCKGEWYLSGAKIEAYRAPNHLQTPFHIARIVVGRQVSTFVPDP